MTHPSLPPLDERREQVDRFDFRAVHPNVRFGTASDRYAGWLGQIYPEERYGGDVTARRRSLGGRSFEERKVPVASVRDYFEHFGVLEIDFTFYSLLTDDDGEASSMYYHLAKYADHAPDSARFILKAPQVVFARTLRRGGDFVSNDDFLNRDLYVDRFLEPARDLLGDRLDGVIFQQEYQRVADSPSPEENVADLESFFSAVPTDEVQAHLELRSSHLMQPVYFDWLEERGLGHVFSHWTWLPPIRKQWAMCGERLTAGNDQVVARLLTPRNTKYADAYAMAHPFDRPRPELAETEQAKDMVLDATALAYRAADQGALLNVIANNRAWGNAPDLARTIANRILDEEERR